jgi:hypothetical protein
MSVSEAVRFDGGPNRLQPVTVNRHIYIPGKSGGRRVNLIYMQVGREAPDNTNWNARFLEDRREARRNVNNLLHGTLEYSVGEHGLYLKV